MNDTHLRRIEDLEYWQRPITIEALPGGITNFNYRVRDAGGCYVARLCVELPLLGIERRNEAVCHRAAQACGVAPAVVYHEKGVLVSQHIDGRTLTPAEVREPDFIPRLAAVLRSLHESWDQLTGEILYFSPFQAIRTYAGTALRLNARMPTDIDAILDDARALSHRLAPFTPVLCHNDLLAGNIIAERDRVWLVDWEYAGMGHPLFDLAGVAANCGFSESLEVALLTHYRGSANEKDLRELRLLKTMSFLRDALWGVIQTVASDIDFDYQKYARDNFTSYRDARKRLDRAYR